MHSVLLRYQQGDSSAHDVNEYLLLTDIANTADNAGTHAFRE